MWSIEEFDVLIKSENISINHKAYIRKYYRKIHELYLKLCQLCNKENMTEDDEENFLNLSTEMSDVLRIAVSINKKQSITLRDALTLMFCNEHYKCINHSGINGDTNFLNWMSHEASHIANKYMGVTDEFINKIPGAESIDELVVNVRQKLSPYLTKKLGEISFSEDMRIAYKGYTIDERFRQIRHPPDYFDEHCKAICGEVPDGGHKHRSNLATAIDIVLSEWIEVNSLN